MRGESRKRKQTHSESNDATDVSFTLITLSLSCLRFAAATALRVLATACRCKHYFVLNIFSELSLDFAMSMRSHAMSGRKLKKYFAQ